MELCPECGAEVAVGASFCVECGATVTRACPACGTPATRGRFCAHCGHELAAEPTVARAATATGGTAPHVGTHAERRVTSVLFADLVGFTPIAEGRDPEDVRDLLSRYFTEARTVIARYGGLVEKFIGDAVMAVWGVPVAHEDDAERSVRAGLELVGAINALGEELGVDGMSVRVGVVTGEVAVTVGATGAGDGGR